MPCTYWSIKEKPKRFFPCVARVVVLVGGCAVVLVVAMCEYVSLKARGRSFRGHGGTLLKAIEEACLRTKRIANDTK